MTYRLRTGLHLALPGRHAILLDEQQDRYFRLGEGASRALAEALSEAPSAPQETVQQLCTRGILVTAPEPVPERMPALPRPCRDTLEDDGREEWISAAMVWWAHLGARRDLARHGLAATLARCRARACASYPVNQIGAAAVARAVRRRRAWLPLTARCLPDAIALHALLCRRKLRSSLVIGVRDQPFLAHSWVQAGDIVLNDSQDEVAALTPILVL